MATEKRLIDANEAMEYAQKVFSDPVLLYAIKTVLDNAPTVDVVEVVHGRWEPRQDVIGFVRCSVCHDCNIYGDWADGKKWNYCPNCGAKNGDGNG